MSDQARATARVTAQVASLYASHPYPARDPEEERTRLIGTWLDDLRLVNHYGLGGAADFRGLRVLVAGGGTGDATVYLAEQLREVGGEVVHLDLSDASIAIARRRAEIRALPNVRFVQGSLLDLPQLGLGEFGLINCVGVLHHLADPEAGLDRLLEALAPDGVLTLMLYAQVGRTAVYQMQELLRRLDAGVDSLEERIAHARSVLGVLPATNWFVRSAGLHRDHEAGGDAGLADLLLHPQDRAYTVSQLYEWLVDRCGLHLHLSDWHRGAYAYEPAPLLAGATPEVRAQAARLPLREAQAVAELLRGDIITHTLYATRRADTVAPYGDADMVPMFANDRLDGAGMVALIGAKDDAPFELTHRVSGLAQRLDPGRHVKEIFRALDERSSFARIFDAVRRAPGIAGSAPAPSDEQLFAEFAPWYHALNRIERMVLRRPHAYAGIAGRYA
ncbi:MAG TPA: class I SAM-dependent methyltransferase [Burkholderiaceae bacterium]|nr:class I SAM-dependent methyltransferase [Burkholderiaceae bacterium]